MEFKNKFLLGNCVDIIKTLPDDSVGCCITSPPYAMQRTGDSSTGAVLYNGVSEDKFPAWTVEWMESLKPKLKMDASVFIVIRSHVRNGEVSDYVMRTRLAVREAGWKECEELIWHKPDAPPLGSNKRPRRTWENILWFSKTGNPYCDLFACGNKNSERTGGFAGSDRFGEGVIAAKGQKKTLKNGTSRITDVVTAAIGTLPRGVMHPAMYPEGIAETLIKSFSREGDLILDPFMGSGQTALAAIAENRCFTGIDLCPEYVAIAENRINS